MPKFSAGVFLRAGNESSVERLLKQIGTFMSDIADEFKIVVVEAIRSLCLKFPQKYRALMNFLSNVRASALLRAALRNALHAQRRPLLLDRTPLRLGPLQAYQLLCSPDALVYGLMFLENSLGKAHKLRITKMWLTRYI